jgi:hypothetical protein
MNEFLLFALIIVYLAIRHGSPADSGSDQQGSATEPSSHRNKQ